MCLLFALQARIFLHEPLPSGKYVNIYILYAIYYIIIIIVIIVIILLYFMLDFCFSDPRCFFFRFFSRFRTCRFCRSRVVLISCVCTARRFSSAPFWAISNTETASRTLFAYGLIIYFCFGCSCNNGFVCLFVCLFFLLFFLALFVHAFSLLFFSFWSYVPFFGVLQNVFFFRLFFVRYVSACFFSAFFVRCVFLACDVTCPVICTHSICVSLAFGIRRKAKAASTRNCRSVPSSYTART